MAFESPLANPYRRSRHRRGQVYRTRGRGGGTGFNPTLLGFLGYYDVHAGGSSTQITDSSGNSLAATSFAAAGNSPTWLGHSGTDYLWTPGTASNLASATYGLVSGDVSLRYNLGAFTNLASNPWIVTGPWYSLRALAAGRIRLQSSAATNDSTNPVPSIGSADVWVRGDINTASGAVAHYYSSDGSIWTANGSASLAAPTVSALSVSLAAPATALLGRTYAFQSIVNGTTTHNFSASLCGQSGYTDAVGSAGQAWTVSRSSAGLKLAVVKRGVVAFGTDDYATAPAGAIPSMGASDAWSVMLVIRQHDTPTNFGRYLSTKLSSGTGKGIAIRSNGTTRQISCHFGDGTNVVDSFGPSAASAGVVQVIVVSCTGPSVTVYVNGVTGTPVDVSSVGDRATGQMQIGRDSGSSSNYQDFELLTYGTASRAFTAGEAAALSTYFGGGS